MSSFDNANIEFVIGSSGDFIVEVDKDVIYSKKDLIGCDSNRFPHIGEIASLIQSKYDND